MEFESSSKQKARREARKRKSQKNETNNHLEEMIVVVLIGHSEQGGNLWYYARTLNECCVSRCFSMRAAHWQQCNTHGHNVMVPVTHQVVSRIRPSAYLPHILAAVLKLNVQRPRAQLAQSIR